ncbi:phospho-sugar mutase [Pyramidobacter sp. C12-8]|uniref:phospho-sugar mutase n=1 Tax=Pyramidobacter sp. C12-8 TaxID=1943580 RepID=UPI00098EE35E|nr:phospho-sugar mutase [Pyramidobacter sp. C12-8]OON89016.1 phosphoglucomutase [Pyramidobacter sp. C12-8]
MTYRERYEQWLGASWLDEASRRELAALSDEKEIEDRFYRDLEFGTAGMRGVMGAGTNRLNRYTVGKATLGLARYLKAEIADWQRGVVVAYDSRNRSSEFALETARVLSACGVPVKIFRQLEPVPALSFAVKHHKAAAGVVITASHNPKEYNGYKVYDEHGCQLCPAPAAKLTRYVEAADLAQIPPGDEKLIAWIGQETVEAFLDAVQCQSVPQRDAGALKVVYTPLHGSGNLPVRAILKRCGFADVQVVAEQELPDGDFPTVTAPNPEERSTLSLGIELARRVGADVVIGTDPDSDRIGCAVAAGGEFRLLSGNQIGALLADFVLSHRALTPKSTMITTIVTGELGARVAQSRGVTVLRTLTGFKYIGEKITEFARSGEREFLFGYEESYGYLAGTHAQDKDAVVAAMLICEMAAAAKSQGRTLIDELDGLYARFGYYLDAQESHTLKGKDGAERIAAMMARLRGGARFEGVSQTLDYAQGLDGLPRENVMKFLCADGSWFAVRPSGTEPKIKIYYSIKDADETSARAKLAARRAEVGGVLGL